MEVVVRGRSIAWFACQIYENITLFSKNSSSKWRTLNNYNILKTRWTSVLFVWIFEMVQIYARHTVCVCSFMLPLLYIILSFNYSIPSGCVGIFGVPDVGQNDSSILHWIHLRWNKRNWFMKREQECAAATSKQNKYKPIIWLFIVLWKSQRLKSRRRLEFDVMIIDLNVV